MNLEHIAFNDFYSTNAFPKWNFDINFTFYVGTGTITEENKQAEDKRNEEYSKMLSKAVTDVKFPGTRIEKLITYLPGMQYAYPGKPNINGELILTFNDDIDLNIRRVANYLMQKHYNPRYQQQEILDDWTDGYESKEHFQDIGEKYFDIYVRLRDQQNRCVQKIVYKSCFVKTVGALDLDYAGEDIVKTAVTFSYPYFKVLEPEGQDSE